jgi:hypothetical protein
MTRVAGSPGRAHRSPALTLTAVTASTVITIPAITELPGGASLPVGH